MRDIAIKVENLGKKYIIKHEDEKSYKTFREEILKKSKNIFYMLNPFSSQENKDTKREEFWALKDLNFEIRKGDKVGIIGKNGAGKSTLLKLLSRITTPTRGKICINGRVNSLLEVGTGFHPELTGRENIFLNGAILGMTRQEIKKKFDEIVAFAGIEKFLDTPVKRYSSGMYVRLAFSVAAHLDTEILLVDEVLAVGDVEFQKKSLGKMDNVSKKEGRTILFVSHNMSAIRKLCNKSMLLENGKVKIFSSNVSDVIGKYYAKYDNKSAIWEKADDRFLNEYIDPLEFRIIDKFGKVVNAPIKNDEDYFVEIKIYIKKLDPALCIGYSLSTEDGQVLFWSYNTDTAKIKWPKLRLGINILKSPFPKKLLNEGRYKLELIGSLHFIKWFYQPGTDVPTIFIEIRGGISKSPYMYTRRPTLLAPIIPWEVIYDTKI